MSVLPPNALVLGLPLDKTRVENPQVRGEEFFVLPLNTFRWLSSASLSLHPGPALIITAMLIGMGVEYTKKEGNVLFNDALNTFYLRLYGVGHMVKNHSDCERKPAAAT